MNTTTNGNNVTKEVPFANQYLGEYKDTTTKGKNWIMVLIEPEQIRAYGKGFDGSYFMSVDYFLEQVKDGTLGRVD